MVNIDQLLQDAYGDVRNDVIAAIKAHPQYQQFLDAVAAKGIQELFALVSTAA